MLPRAATGEAIKYYSTNRRDTRISLPSAATEFTQHVKLHLGAVEKQELADISDSLVTTFVGIQLPYFCSHFTLQEFPSASWFAHTASKRNLAFPFPLLCKDLMPFHNQI